MIKEYKYALVFTLPVTVYISFTSYGILTFLPFMVFFGLVPFLELFIKPNNTNYSSEDLIKAKQNRFFDVILYLVLPVQIIALFFFLYTISDASLSVFETMGRISSMGLMCGVFGINAGHELGHRANRLEQLMGEILLLTSLDMHFLPYHNAGHHYNVATPEDAATAGRNEWLFAFWIKSHFRSYYDAWKIEGQRMKKLRRMKFSVYNRMVVYTIANIITLSAILYFFGFEVLLAFLAASVIGILLLETVNYIEHYGLLRQKIENGRYERVNHQHSWNSDHLLGRLFLFNLSRHSDHHYNGSKKYQLLNSLSESPQMTTGYPGMMLFSLVQPLWFRFMNKRLDRMKPEND